ncbi:MAG: DUF4348 domain-containing protein [Prevotella sp.]|nr:DUF4348 domain-containing protein [Prevotella sp.]
MKRILIAFCTLAVLYACNANKQQATDGSGEADSAAMVADTVEQTIDEAEYADIPMPKAADELFDDFFFNFAASKKLQMERIIFPLKSVNGDKTTEIDRKAWKMEYFFMRQGYYTLLFDNERHMDVVKDTTVRHAVVEKIYFNTSSVIQYVFDRIRGTWMLTQMRTIPISSSSNATFLEFFHHFATDKEFQAESLGSTVSFVGPDPDDDFATMEGVITPDTWEALAPELPQKMIYNIVYGQEEKEGNSKLFLLRGISNGLELQMTFQRTDGRWRLVKLTT